MPVIVRHTAPRMAKDSVLTPRQWVAGSGSRGVDAGGWAGLG